MSCKPRGCTGSEPAFGSLPPGFPERRPTSRPRSYHPQPSLAWLSFLVFRRSGHRVSPQRCSPTRLSPQGWTGSPCGFWGPDGAEFSVLTGYPLTPAEHHPGVVLGVSGRHSPDARNAWLLLQELENSSLRKPSRQPGWILPASRPQPPPRQPLNSLDLKLDQLTPPVPE